MNDWPQPCATKLVRVPAVQPFESPASWIARLACSQVVDPGDILAFLAVDRPNDPDLAFTRAVASRAANACDIKFSSFRFMRHMLCSLRMVNVPLDTFLLTVDGLPQYRFCKLCLREQREKHFPFHWRFKSWRWCPDHQRLMEDRCPHCEALVVLPAGLLQAAEGRRGRGTLDQCMVCNGSLCGKGRGRRFDAMRAHLTPWERHLIANGRAALAALWKRTVILSADTGVHRRGLRELAKIERSGLLPHGPMHFERYDSTPKRYRHPLTQAIVRAPNVSAKPKRVSGLFE